MLNWLKTLLGVAPVTPAPVVDVAAKPKVKKAAPKKKATKKTVDLSAMKKDELLAHAKKAGAKVNAGMKKADIITAINAV